MHDLQQQRTCRDGCVWVDELIVALVLKPQGHHPLLLEIRLVDPCKAAVRVRVRYWMYRVRVTGGHRSGTNWRKAINEELSDVGVRYRLYFINIYICT